MIDHYTYIKNEILAITNHFSIFNEEMDDSIAEGIILRSVAWNDTRICDFGNERIFSVVIKTNFDDTARKRAEEIFMNLKQSKAIYTKDFNATNKENDTYRCYEFKLIYK